MGCGPSDMKADELDGHVQASSRVNSRRRHKKEVPLDEKRALSIRRGVPLPPRISVTVPPDVDSLDLVPTTPVENPTLCGHVFVPPPIPIALHHGGQESHQTYRLTLRRDKWVFDDSAEVGEDQELYIFDMFQYASKSADMGTTVALVHRHSGSCIASSSEDGRALVADFPDWMAQDCDEVRANPRFFLRYQDAPESEYTLFRCHDGAAKYLARDTDTNQAYLTPWIRYPSQLQMKLIGGHSNPPSPTGSGDGE